MVHQFKNNGYYLVLDVNSGSVHQVDELFYNILPLYEEGKKKEEILSALSGKDSDSNPEVTLEAIEETLEEMEELKAQGTLFTEDPYEPYIRDFRANQTVVKALCLHVAHDCNLACKYCFAEEGEYKGRRGMMTVEIGKQAMKFLVENSGNRRNLEVDFFGGEPTMNMDVVRACVAYGRELEKQYEKHFRFTITTNGVLLDPEMMEFINREMDNVVLSLDGRPEVNDKMRPFRKGVGSYAITEPKLLAMAKSRKGKSYYVRGTFTRYNLDFVQDVLHFADLGFQEISIEPVVTDPKEEYALRPEDVPTICKEYDKLAAEMAKRIREGNCFTFFHFMMDLSGGPCVYKRLAGCGSGTEYMAVTPWGELYPCHQFVGEEEFKMGDVYQGVTKPEIRETFRQNNVYAKEKCKECFARFFCSGGCAANSYHAHGTILDTYDVGCDLERKRVECALMLKAVEAEVEGEKES